MCPAGHSAGLERGREGGVGGLGPECPHDMQDSRGGNVEPEQLHNLQMYSRTCAYMCMVLLCMCVCTMCVHASTL